MPGLIGKKIGMTSVFDKDGKNIPCTVIQAGPCTVTQVKSVDTDGYASVQLAFDEKKEKNTPKAELGHFAKANTTPKKKVIELKGFVKDWKPGDVITVDYFHDDTWLDVSGMSKGKGFQGGMKRWGWKGQCASHGSMTHRRPGSIGASAFPSRVLKGHHLPGRMGGRKNTIQNLKIVKIDSENNLLMVKGPVAGHRNSYLIIKNAKKIQQVVKPDKK